MLEVRGMDKLTTAVDEISDELHHQYSLGYYPEKQNWDGKFRKIQIVTQEQATKSTPAKAITPILRIRRCGRKTPVGFCS